MKAYVDANIFILAQFGQGEKGEIASRIVGNLEEGKFLGVTCSLTIGEIMWAILRQKRRSNLKELISDVYALPNLSIVDTPAHAPMAALEFMEKFSLKPRDAIHAAMMHYLGLSAIYSDDADFDRVKGIKRIF